MDTIVLTFVLSELEVTTDAHLPTLTIVSPTPRAFTFPSNFTNDIRSISPSASPFEPDPKSFATPPPQRAFSPSSSIGSETCSSLFSSPSVASSQASQRRRRSVASDNERRPKKGDEDYIKRPENAFILFRRKCCEDRQQAMDEATSSVDEPIAPPAKRQRQADLSKQISQQWKSLSAEERTYWEELAKEKKKQHEAMYPNYVYRPQRTKDKRGKKGKGKGDGDGETDVEGSISFVLPVPCEPRSLSRGYTHGHGHGHSNRRAVSAPTPPPAYQTIQLPTVFMPSCPTSPSLVPRISRRTPLPNHHIPHPSDSDPSTHYEYLPNDTLYPPLRRLSYDTNMPVSTHQSLRLIFEQKLTSLVLQSSDPFQSFQFNGQQPAADRNVPLHSLNIPEDANPYCPSLISPADSIASSIFSPPDSLASCSPRGGPYTPAENLSMSALSIANQPGDSNVDDLQEETATLGFGGYTWGSQALWPEPGDAMQPDDFDLSSIPPIELGATCDMDNNQYGSMAEEHEYNDTTPGGDDPFANLFAYDNMNW
ncbi:unnamed protein product [Somion occarium]|uniref:HMG box domain-containing protein n=1 Tax=Somion occarium TaxID=3059160 RepID=A0ABP1CXR8_9APHY